jgi:hypothetical protein
MSAQKKEEEFIPMPTSDTQSITANTTASDTKNEVAKSSLSVRMRGGRGWLGLYRRVPFLLWCMVLNVCWVTPMSVFYMLTVPGGTYRPFPPLWGLEAVTPPPMTSPVWWLVLHSLIASAAVLLWFRYFASDPRRIKSLAKSLSIVNWVFVLLIFINPFRFSDIPWVVAFMINIGCALSMLWFIPKQFRLSTHFPTFVARFIATLDIWDRRYLCIHRLVDPIMQRVMPIYNTVVMSPPVEWKNFDKDPVFATLVSAHSRYPGQIDVYLTTLGLPILYFYLKAFFLVSDTIFKRVLVAIGVHILRQLHQPPQGQLPPHHIRLSTTVVPTTTTTTTTTTPTTPTNASHTL